MPILPRSPPGKEVNGHLPGPIRALAGRAFLVAMKDGAKPQRNMVKAQAIVA